MAPYNNNNNNMKKGSRITTDLPSRDNWHGFHKVSYMPWRQRREEGTKNKARLQLMNAPNLMGRTFQPPKTVHDVI